MGEWESTEAEASSRAGVVGSSTDLDRLGRSGVADEHERSRAQGAKVSELEGAEQLTSIAAGKEAPS